MSGLHKLTCTGAIFMSEKETTDKCPSYSKQILDNMQHESDSSIGGGPKI